MGDYRTLNRYIPPVGAALCCEEAGTATVDVMALPASSQHRAAPQGETQLDYRIVIFPPPPR
ncbi:hypothetical protein E8E78_08350 [Pseudomonas sp. BN505]|nr:hypothetical protein [Pseudomonas sp. BN605]MDH4856610.1 hypothetical protein [Pseudomonas sp. BN505]